MSWTARLRMFNGIVPPRSHSLRYGDRADRRALISARILALSAVLAGVAYLLWLSVTINWYHPWVGAAFLAAETYCFILLLTASFTVWKLRYKPPEGLPLLEYPPVDIFVPVCGEPAAVITATLDAVRKIEWHGRLQVYVLDDCGDDWVRRAAHDRGFSYLSRRTRNVAQGHAKAGNLNFGLDHSNGEFVLVLDADQVARPSILTALAGYMRFADVGFIQSRQLYFVPEGDPFFNLDPVFYNAVQLGYDDRDTALSCGSGVLYRRAALLENGGFSEWNVIEDLTTSYDLHSRGWRSFYYPHALTMGLAPADIWGVYRQRSQWALDTMRLFFWDNPLLKRGLRWPSRISYLVIPLAYACAGFVFPLFFLIPVWTYITGGSVLAGSELQFVIMRGIYGLLMAFALRTMFRWHHAGRQFQTLAGLFPVYLSGTLRALFYPPSRESGYRPNNAPGRRKPPALLAVLPQIGVVAANAVLPFYAIVNETAQPRLIVGNAFISALAIWTLVPVIAAALGSKEWDRTLDPHGQ
jgi:cellulose synthase (UDP-forming)